jgi:hypothetical protein
MMEAVRTSKTSVHFNVTIWRYIPEDSKLHTRRENLKSHTVGYMLSEKYNGKCRTDIANAFLHSSAPIRGQR